MKKIIFLLIAFGAYCAVTGNSAESLVDLRDATLSTQPQESPDQANIQSKIEKERAALIEVEGKIKKDEKLLMEIMELKTQLKEIEKAARSKPQKKDDVKRLQIRLEKVRSQRVATEEQMRKAEEKIKASEESVAVLTNMIAAAEQQQEKDKETVRTIASLTDELKKETALANEATARVDKQNRDLKTLEDEKARLNQRLILVKENLGRKEQSLIKLDETRLQIAEQKKSRADMETKLQQTTRDQDVLKKEKEQLNLALIEAGNLVLKNEKAGQVADELQKEKELARKSADLLREKEQSVKQLADAKAVLQNKLNDTQTNLAQQKERIKDIEEKRRALDEEKKTKLVSEEKYSALAQTEKEHKEQIKELRSKTRAATEKSASLSLQLEQAEKERLLLANQLAEPQQNLPLQQKDSPDQSDIQGEIEKEKKTVWETEEKIRRDEKAYSEAEKKIAELKTQLKEVEKTARSKSQKEDDANRLQSRLEKVRSQRVEAEERMRKAEGKLKESEASAAVLTNLIATAERQQEKDKETVRTIASLTDELNKETALANETTARVDKQNRDLQALEDEKARLNQRLILVKENLGRKEQGLVKLDETRLQIAEQKKIRADAETKLQQTTRKQDALGKEKEQLNQALIEAGNLILKNEKDYQKAGLVADELQKEKELARKSADLLREKEQSVKQLADDQAALQNKLNDTQTNLAQQKERIKDIEEKRRALDEAKKAKLVSEKKYSELAQAEKEHKEQIKELKSKTRAATETLSSQAEAASRQETLVVSQARTGAGQNSTASASEPKETKNMANMTEGSGKDALAVEQDILNKARAGDQQPSGEDIGADQRQGKKAAKQAGSRRQNQLAQAEKHYELGIQKWDENDLDGATAEFKNTIRLNPDAAGAYYNISLVYLRQGRKEEACDYAYKAGECYLRIKNPTQATRMSVLLMKIDQTSPLIQKLRNKIDAATK